MLDGAAGGCVVEAVEDLIAHHRTLDYGQNDFRIVMSVACWFSGSLLLSDSSSDYRKFRIPAGSIVPPLGYLVFDETAFNPTPLEPEAHHFALGRSRGDDGWLMEANDDRDLVRFADHVDFDAARLDETLGRWPNGEGELYPMITGTLFRRADSFDAVGEHERAEGDRELARARARQAE